MPTVQNRFLSVRRFTVAAWALLAACVLPSACREATEIRLHVSTNVPCTDPDMWQGVAVYVGAPGADVETKAPALTATTCDANGQVGTLVVVPSGSKDAEVGLKVVAGLGIAPEDCAAKNYKGCIVARRAVRFTAHGSIDLDVPLTSDCVNVSCDAQHTCVNASCTDSQTAEVIVDPSQPSVRCGDNGIRCPTSGNVCCLTVNIPAGTATGECRPAQDCPSTSTVLNCDDSSQCGLGTGGLPRSCVISYDLDPATTNGHVPNAVSGAACVDSASQRLELCGERRACSNPNVECHTSTGFPMNPLPGYFWCED